jgi:long-chain fatty acid transport protein
MVVSGLVVSAGAAQAGGAYIYEMSNASEVGYGGAGMVARANDAGTVFSNPAGMTRFDKSEMMAGALAVYIDAGFSTNENNPASGKASGLNKGITPAGNFGYIRPLTDRLSAGVSMHNYFGLALDWNDDWVGRHSSVNLMLVAPQIQPTLAYKVNDWLSVGAGAALTLGYMYDKSRVEAVIPDGKEGKFRLSDTDFAVQGNFGIMLQPWEHTRIGIRYLTETDLDFEDSPDISGVNDLPDIDPDADFVSPGAKIDLGMKMPQSISAAVHHQWNDELAILGSVAWDEWSEFGYVNAGLDVNGGGGVTTELNADFRDVWHGGVGVEYQWKPRWELTAGFSYDSSMMSSRTRPTFIPLGNMYRYAVGLKHQRSDTLTLGVGLTFLWEGNLPIDDSGGVSGKYNNVSLSFLSFYASWH